MKRLVLDAAVAAKLPELLSPVELVDADGNVFGVFDPYPPKPEYSEPPDSPPAATS